MANSFNKNQEKITLRGYYESLPSPSVPKHEFVLEVMNRCKVRETTVYNWINGRTQPSDPKHIEVLCELTGLKAEELWSEA